MVRKIIGMSMSEQAKETLQAFENFAKSIKESFEAFVCSGQSEHNIVLQFNLQVKYVQVPELGYSVMLLDASKQKLLVTILVRDLNECLMMLIAAAGSAVMQFLTEKTEERFDQN
jgi:hypothetical protein